MPFHFLMLRYLRVILYSSGTGGVVITTIQFRPKLSITGRNWRQCTTLRLVDLIWVHTCFFSLPAPIISRVYQKPQAFPSLFFQILYSLFCAAYVCFSVVNATFLFLSS